MPGLTKQCARCGKVFEKPASCGMPAWSKKRKYCSVECSLAMTFLARDRIVWNKGLKGYNAHVKRTDEWKRRMSESQKGRPKPDRRGPNHHNWKGGISKHKRDLRDLKYVAWRDAVFVRDAYRCQFPDCGRGGDLEAHHIVRWADDETLRFDVGNGISLCPGHHALTKGHEHEYVSLFQQMITYTRV